MVLTVAGDIAQPGVGQRIVDAALQRFGRIDTVVNNAGIFVSKPFTDYTDDDYDAVTGVNLRGFFELSRAAVRAMVAQGDGGHVVNVSTSLVDHANSRVPAALASLTKGGLNAVTKALAIEFADRGIRANAVALGIIATPMHDPASYDALAHRERLLADGRGTCESSASRFYDDTGLIVLENTEKVHNLVVCTLCSCYPRPLLGLPPEWYKLKPYRARAVIEPRALLAEFGTIIPEDVEVRVAEFDIRAALPGAANPARGHGRLHRRTARRPRHARRHDRRRPRQNINRGAP